MCGIFAWAGLEPGQYNKDKFDKLGILNEVRGKDSAGISVDGRIQVGIDKNKLYRDFIANCDIPVPVEIPIVIGHTRASTVGGNTAANAHPFGFDCDDDERYAFIGVHNGTLLNHEELAKQYKIDITVNNQKNEVVRRKIDSEILLESLFVSGNFKVLSQYNGAAATMFYNVEEPNVLYAFHGKSNTYDKIGKPEEERPLYYYQEGPNSLYISSLYWSLVTIGGTSKTIGEFEHNTVYKITDGNMETSVKTRVSRVNNFQKGTARYVHHNSNYTSPSQPKKKAPRYSHVKQTGEGLNIYGETPIVNINQLGGRVYFNKLRFWRNGHRINGFYTYVAGHGYYYLGKTIKEAENVFWKYVNMIFVNGEFRSYEDLSSAEVNEGFVPFVHAGNREITAPTIFTFFDGIKIDLPSDYRICVELEAKGKGFDTANLSVIAKHPIIDLNYALRSQSMQNVFYAGELCTGTFCPLGSGKAYTFAKGNLISEMLLTPPPKNLILEVEAGEQVKLELEEEKEEVKEEASNFLEEDLLEEDIIRCFQTAYTNFPRYKTQLSKYLPNPKAKEAIAILDTFIASTYNFIATEEKE